MEEKLKAIREKCIVANPILGTLEECAYCRHEFRRHIHLADVLLARIVRKDPEIDMLGGMRAWAGKRENDEWRMIYWWNLRDDDLEHQSGDCINFLYELFKA